MLLIAAFSSAIRTHDNCTSERMALHAVLSIAALLGAPGWALLILGLVWVGCVAWFAFLPLVYIPRLFKMYGNPWSASAALLANLHLICESHLSPMPFPIPQ